MAKPKTLAIDVESYSAADLPDVGVYRYAEDKTFGILLIAYSVNDGPVHVIDCLGNMGDDDPEGELLNELCDLLVDPTVEKYAFNANFERVTLGQFFALPMDPAHWHCTMVHALTLGLPGSLAAVGQALGLPEDEQKAKTGKALIDYFCKPCKPTKANGGRVRNLPQHDPDKWRLFIEYNRQDVVTEMAIRKRLEELGKVPEHEHVLWALDQQINDRGIRIDGVMVNNIIDYDEAHTAELLEEAKMLSGLSNPNSLPQLKAWLAKYGISAGSLTKDSLEDLLQTDLPDAVRRVLEIRQATGKTSTAKYAKMAGAVCRDGRLRGTLQFYGASRSGRWCLTGDHEVLTPDGWMRLDEWQGGPIMCWDKTMESLSFQRSTVVSFDYEGPMVHWHTQRIDQLATPDHKMAVLNAKTGTLEAKKIDELTGRVNVAFTGVRTRQTETGQNWALRLLVAIQADGTYTEDGTVRFHFSKKRKIERAVMLLRKNQITYSYAGHSDGTSTISIRPKDQPIWVRQFRSKIFGFWVLDENLDAFFDELPNWDGYYSGPNSMQYVTCVKQNADVVQAAAICAGMTATVLIKKRSGEWHDAYVISVWQNPGKGTRVNTADAAQVQINGKVYCASTKTGFFVVRRNGKMWITGNSGKLVQVHNLARNAMPDLDLARELVCEGDVDTLETLYGEPSFVFSELVRTALIPSEGHLFVVSDFSAIEARVVAWVAGEQWVLDAFRAGKDIYCETASMMYHVPVVKHGENGELRQKGKIAVLACGYQGGVGAMKQMDKGGTIPDEELQSVVDQWRKANPMIVKLWKDVEKAAITAIEEHRSVRRGIRVPADNLEAREAMAGGPVRPYSVREGVALVFNYKDGNLYITLPSGRSLCYFGARLKDGKYGPQIIYKGVNQTTKKWEDTETYGGKLVENIVQGIARDCLAEAMLRVDALGFKIVMHVHDEMIVDVTLEQGPGSLKYINEAMGAPIDWAPGLPLKGDGYVCDFYRKD